jgi:hypothetical protein
MEVTYSGYNGAGRNDEYIQINTPTTTFLKMRVFAYEKGEAEVVYSWTRSQTQCCRGLGSCVGEQFRQQILPNKMEKVVGRIPVGKRKVSVLSYASDMMLDADLHLIDEKTGTVIISSGKSETSPGLLSGEDDASVWYKGVKYTYSGYWGLNNNPSKESILIEGVTNRPLLMKVHGLKSGYVKVDYTYYDEEEAMVAFKNEK